MNCMEWTLRVTMMKNPSQKERHQCGWVASSMKTQKRRMKTHISTPWKNSSRGVKKKSPRSGKPQKKIDLARILLSLFTIYHLSGLSYFQSSLIKDSSSKLTLTKMMSLSTTPSAPKVCHQYGNVKSSSRKHLESYC